MGNWLYRLTIVGLLLGLQAETVCAASDGLSLIHVTFLNCGRTNAVETVKLHVADLQAHRDVTNEVEYSLQKTPLGVTLDVRLAPGFYHVGIGNQGCYNSILLPVLQGRNQNVLFIGTSGIRLRESTAMVAGALPFTGYSASIAYYPQDQVGRGSKILTVIPARVDGNAYYSTALGVGIARLRVSTADGSERLEFKIGEINTSAARRYIVFNVSENDVKNALNAPELTYYPLKAGTFTLSSPPDMYQRQGDVTPLSTDYYYYEKTSSSPLLKVTEGKGLYDLEKFTKLCLNGRFAWRTGDDSSGTVFMGERESWVTVSWSNLSGEQLSEARTIVSSMQINFGPTCEG